jgi:hypothetical protein
MLSYQKTGKRCQRDFRAKKGSKTCVYSKGKRKVAKLTTLKGKPDMRFRVNKLGAMLGVAGIKLVQALD